jgi:hypothetical protein
MRSPVPLHKSQTRCSSTGCVPRLSQDGQLRLETRPTPPHSGHPVYSVRRTKPAPVQAGQYRMLILRSYNTLEKRKSQWLREAL